MFVARERLWRKFISGEIKALNWWRISKIEVEGEH
jgi:hypothetical protein